MAKQPLKEKRLTAAQIRQIEIDTNTDDLTVSEFLEECHNPNHKFPYSDAFVEKMTGRKPVNTGVAKK